MIINTVTGGGSGGLGGGVIVSGTEPEGNSTLLWVDISNGGIAKYWNGEAWVAICALSTWG